MSHRRSAQCAMPTCQNDDHHDAFTNTSNCKTFHSDLVQMVEILKIASGRLWKSRSMSWIQNRWGRWAILIKKLVDAGASHKLPAKIAWTWQPYFLQRSDNVYSGRSETEMPRSVWMQMIKQRNHILAVHNDCMEFWIKLLSRRCPLVWLYGEP